MSQSKTASRGPAEASEPDFLSRWSRVKHQARRELTSPEGADDAVKNTVKPPADGDNSQEQATSVLTDADMPDIDSLTPDSDYSGFMSPGVSDELRKLALRKLFHSDVFNVTDGLNEYDGDYTQFEKLGDIVTADMKHQIEMESRRRAQQLLQESDQTVETARIDNPANPCIRQQAEQVDTSSGDGVTPEIDQQQPMTEARERSAASTGPARHKTANAANIQNERTHDDGE